MKKRGAAHLALLNTVTGVTAVVLAVAGIELQQASDKIELPVTVGGILQIVALGGIAVIWWLARNAFLDLRDRVNSVRDKIGKLTRDCNRIAERVSYIEGTCGACSMFTKRAIPLPPPPPSFTQEEEREEEDG